MRILFNTFIILFYFCTALIACSSCSSDSNDSKSGDDDVYNLKIDNMHIRDPFIVVDQVNQVYYMHVNGNKKVNVYKSKDLVYWKNMGAAFIPESNFWGKSDFWAPDVFLYKGKYYLFITLSAPNCKRGTSILISDKPDGPFKPLVNNAVTPSDWMCLDGTLYIDEKDEPWILYCHEWLEAGDGEVIAQKLDNDLTKTIGDPIQLFKASEAPWVGDITSGTTTGKVTDAPFIHRLDNGQLIMLWSSFRKTDGKYAIGQAISKSGNVAGPWIQEKETLNNDDGGHAMLFNDLQGKLMISYHSPNSNTERPTIKQVNIENGIIVIPN